MVLGDWHGEVTALVVASLTGHGGVSTATLATGGSLPDPEVWLRRPCASPVGDVSIRLARWDARDGVHKHAEPTSDGCARVWRAGLDDGVDLPDGGLLPVRALLGLG